MQLAEGVYAPDMHIDYPTDDPYSRLYKPVYDREFVIDENYDFIADDPKWHRKQRWGYRMILHLVLGTKLRVQMGMKVEGRDWLKKYKEQLKGGAITLGNHCYRLDCPAILLAVGAKPTTKIPMFAPNFRTKDGFMMRLVGGIPIPPVECGMAAMKKFNAAFDFFHEKGYWFHIFPEAARWDYYKPLRPFQKGAFTMSYKYDMPLVPCVIKYRERKGIYRLFGPKEMPLLTVVIGEPIIPDKTKPRKDEVERLREVAHLKMEEMAGITHNSWPIAPEKE